MKKLVSLLLIVAMALSLCSFAAAEDYTDVTIRIYSYSNSTERANWLQMAAKEAGFTISMDDNSVLSGDVAAIQAANENKDGDVIFGLNEVRWSQLVNGTYENLKVMDWTPSWAEQVGQYKYDGKAYGLVIQNILMLYRTDDLGTKGEKLHFEHWADIVNCGYTWYRQGKVGGTTNGNINNSMLYAFTDPASPAGGISIEGWKTLWAYCQGGVFTGDSYGFDPLNRGDVQVSPSTPPCTARWTTRPPAPRIPSRARCSPKTGPWSRSTTAPTTSPNTWASWSALTAPSARPRP